jgi:hypothetical protein
MSDQLPDSHRSAWWILLRLRGRGRPRAADEGQHLGMRRAPCPPTAKLAPAAHVLSADARIPERSVTREPASPRRVVVIDRCDTIQAGRDNVQYSAYRASLATPRLELGPELLDNLYNRRAPWFSEAFHHTGALPNISQASSRSPSVSKQQFVPDSRGGTVIIVKNSRNVQIGKHAAQANEFRLYAADYTITADNLVSRLNQEIIETIERLRVGPTDMAAVRTLAEKVIEQAQRYMTLKMDRKLKRDIGRPQINRWPCEIRQKTGRQIGGPGNRAYVTTQVEPPRIDRKPVERQIIQQARRVNKRTRRHR